MHSILWIVILIIVYGSLFPFNFEWVEVSQIAWLDWGTQIWHRTTNGDILSNFLTFVPLGYFGFVGTRIYKDTLWKKALLVILAGGLFAFALQLLQFFLPSRIPTAGDALINFFGVIVGVAIALYIRYWLTHNPQAAIDWSTKISIPMVMVAIWVLYQLFPFVPEFSVSNLVSGAENIWLPPYFTWNDAIYLAAMWYFFLAFVFYSLPGRLTITRTGLIVFGLLIAKVVIAHNFVTTTGMIAAILALVLTHIFPLREWKLQHCIVICSVIFLREVYPISEKSNVSEFNWIPFNYYLSGSMWVNTHVFLEKLFSYGCLIFAMSEYLGQRYRGLFYSAIFILAIELIQLVVNVKSADITDLLIIAIVGYTFQQFKQVKLV